YDPAKAGERTWLCTIAKNLLCDLYRKNASNKSDLVEDSVLEAIPYEDEYAAVEDDTNKIVYKILEDLNDEEREIISMRYMMDMKNPDIAEVLKISPKAVSERIRRALAKCKKVAEKNNLDILVDF
ncbi:MAG: sigma-70 family RNA polymerase sigma factor, partial [Lachnospiraceae bacterium]|nr:sigma-70 family RNA polymerase sigma factor [Lachnospiraceae bacterium]